MNNARDLSARLRQLLRREQGAMADFLIALATFDRERRWQELGHASLFSYLHRELGLSKSGAFYRKTAAELLQAFPEVIEPLRDGRLCLSTVGELARVITPENKDQVLPSFFHLSKREAREVAAALDPVATPPRREVVTALRPASAALALTGPASGSGRVSLLVVLPEEPGVRDADHPAELVPALPARPPPPPPSTAEPLTEALSRLHLTVSRDFLAKLEAARDALAHSRPGASSQEILEAGLDLILREADRRKASSRSPARPGLPRQRPAAARPRPPQPASQPTSAARSGSAIRAAASGRRRTAPSAAPPTGSSSTTWCHGRAAGPRRPPTSGCSASRTTSTRPGSRWATRSWTGSPEEPPGGAPTPPGCAARPRPRPRPPPSRRASAAPRPRACRW